MLYYWSFSCDEAARYRRAAALLYLSFISVLVVVLKELALAIRDSENAAFEGAILVAQKVQSRRPVGLERLPGTGCLLTSRRWRGVGLYQGQRSRAVVEDLISGVASATATGTPVQFGRGVSRRPDVAAEAAMAASATGYLALVLNDDFEFRRFVVHCACLCLRRPVRSGSGGMLGDRRIRLSPIARWRSGTPWLWPHPWGMAASACCTVAFASC
jgi:hypothetical protein